MSAQCVILFRNPSNGSVGFIGDDGEIAVFDDADKAAAFVSTSKLLAAFPHQIVELGEL